jgi:catechol 2,3-dioxygenase-like lactoylglutathione lyase family enzyme
MQDKLMPIVTVDNLDQVRPFYLDVLGFEEGGAPPDLSDAFTTFSYGSSNIGVTTSAGLPALPDGTSGGTLLIIEITDAAGIRNVMAKRHEDVVGEVLTGWWGAFFDVPDPVGNVFRFLEKSQDIAFDADDGSAVAAPSPVEGDA